MNWKQAREPNLDPVIYQPNGRGGSYALTDWVGWCLAYVATAYASGWAGSSAWEAWTTTTKKRHTDRNFPVGVKIPIWFSGFGGDGHVAILLKSPTGDITIWTSPYKKSQARAEVVHSIEQIERDLRQYDVRYVGWSEDIGGVNVIEPTGQVLGETKGDEMPKANLNATRILARFIGGWMSALKGESDEELKRGHVGRDLEKEVLDWYNSEDGKKFEAYQKEAFAFYEKYKGTDFSKVGNEKANKLLEAVKEAVKE